MNSPERMLAILDLFESRTMEWTTEAMAAATGYSRSTLYRYVKTLTEAGLLASLPGLGYTLGPRVAELDYLMRSRDPLILAGRPIMAELVAEQPGVALLCRRYRRDKVLCVHQEQNAPGFVSNYERGLARPLLRGAASRVILAHLSRASIGTTIEARRDELAPAGLGDSLEEARARLRAIRQRGWDCTMGDVTPGVTGVAAPIFDQNGLVLGSLSITIGESRLSPERQAEIAQRVVFCARVLTRAATRIEDAPTP